MTDWESAVESGFPAELVILDCASRDGSAEAARAHAPASIPTAGRVLEENRGLSGGMNEAVTASTAPLFLSLNADARPEPSFLRDLAVRAEHHPPVGAVTGRLIRPAAGGARLPDACGRYLTQSWRHLNRESDEPDRGQYALAERVFGATGTASLLRLQALLDVAVDGDRFLPEFHSLREDAELCLRQRERGWEVRNEPAGTSSRTNVNWWSFWRSSPL